MPTAKQKLKAKRAADRGKVEKGSTRDKVQKGQLLESNVPLTDSYWQNKR